jgi:hypothetical protein
MGIWGVLVMLPGPSVGGSPAPQEGFQPDRQLPALVTVFFSLKDCLGPLSRLLVVFPGVLRVCLRLRTLPGYLHLTNLPTYIGSSAWTLLDRRNFPLQHLYGMRVLSLFLSITCLGPLQIIYDLFGIDTSLVFPPPTHPNSTDIYFYICCPVMSPNPYL